MAQRNGSLRFTKASIRNWRNFTSADVELERRAFFVGPNASGKSNFLDVFRFLRDIVEIGGGFAEAVRRRGGVSKLRCLAARKEPAIEINVAIGTEEERNAWEYLIEFGQDKQRHPKIQREKVVSKTEVILDRPTEDDYADPARLTQTYLEQINVNQKFREVADFFQSVRYKHVVPQLIREPDRSVGRANDPYGGDFLEQIARTPEKTRKARFHRIVRALQVAVPQLQALEMWRDDRGTPHLRGKYEHWRPQGAWQTEEHFSDGTLRLLGLLWALLDGGGPLLLEEPELSLHPEVVRYLPQMFTRTQRKTARQIFASTHSADLLRDEGIGIDEVFLFFPKGEGTEIRQGKFIKDAEHLLRGGLTLAEIVIPQTRPQKANQLSLFVD